MQQPLLGRSLASVGLVEHQPNLSLVLLPHGRAPRDHVAIRLLQLEWRDRARTSQRQQTWTRRLWKFALRSRRRELGLDDHVSLVLLQLALDVRGLPFMAGPVAVGVLGGPGRDGEVGRAERSAGKGDGRC